MKPEPIFIYDRNVNPSHILAIEPYRQPIDPAKEIFADLNSTVLLTRRPHRLPARRDPETFALMLGLFYLPEDRIALNPLCKISAELFVPKVEMDFIRFPDAKTLLTIDRTGCKRSLIVRTDVAAVREIINGAPLRSEMFELLQERWANDRYTAG